jgi:hypothetical protein
MAGKNNCWEIKDCGREPGGKKCSELGVCPAAADASSNGVNSGVNGGRICWAVAGTLCDGRIHGSFALKQSTCIVCEVFLSVQREEGSKFSVLKPDQMQAILRTVND